MASEGEGLLLGSGLLAGWRKLRDRLIRLGHDGGAASIRHAKGHPPGGGRRHRSSG
jgi:hypothetical protein